MKYIVLFSVIFLFGYLIGISKPIEFVIVIPSFNNQAWAEDNIKSAAQQDYEFFDILVYNDCSTDETLNIIKRYVDQNKLQHKIKIVNNKKRVGALKNFYDAMHSCADHKIILMLDGDDKLANNQVLSYLAKVYSDNNVWLTYGQFMHVPPGKIGSCREFPKEILKNNGFRSYDWVASHLRACRAGLFKKIKYEDFLYKNEFCQVAWDNTLMFPMLESASKEHIKFIPEVLYIYNESNPNSDCRIKRSLVQEIENYIRAKKPYEPLDYLECAHYYD